jgi:hypothetical protein
MNARLKFSLIENHGLRSDEPNCDTSDQRTEREWSTVRAGCSKSATWRIVNSIVLRANKLRSVTSPVDRVDCRVRRAEGLRVASILIRLHGSKFALVAAHGHFALARFSAAPAEVVHNPSFGIRQKLFSGCAAQSRTISAPEIGELKMLLHRYS